MEKDEFIVHYIEICKRMYERMERENSWPWVTEPKLWEEQKAWWTEQENAKDTEMK